MAFAVYMYFQNICQWFRKSYNCVFLLEYLWSFCGISEFNLILVLLLFWCILSLCHSWKWKAYSIALACMCQIIEIYYEFNFSLVYLNFTVLKPWQFAKGRQFLPGHLVRCGTCIFKRNSFNFSRHDSHFSSQSLVLLSFATKREIYRVVDPGSWKLVFSCWGICVGQEG